VSDTFSVEEGSLPFQKNFKLVLIYVVCKGKATL